MTDLSQTLPASISTPTPFQTAPRVVELDVNCRKCGYNLRGLTTEMRCPECGTAVAYSVMGDFIRFSDPGWVMHLRSGVRMILSGIAVYVIILILGIVAGMAAARSGAMPMIAVLAGIGGIVAQILITYGTWRLTEPDPSGLGEDQYGTIRKFIRIALLVGVGGAVLQLAAPYVVLPDPIPAMLAVLQGGCSLVGIAGFCCQLVYLGRLARRIPDDAISQRAKTVLWMMGSGYGVVFAFGVLAFLMARGGPGGGPSAAAIGPLACVAGIAGLVILVAAVMYLFLLEKFGRRLQAEATLARQSWAGLPSPR